MKKISLTNLSKEKLNKREQNQVLGGADCCACYCGGTYAVNDSGAEIFGGNDIGSYGVGKYAM